MVTRNLKYTLNDAVSCRQASTKGSSGLREVFLASAWSALSFLHMSSTPVPNRSRGLGDESPEAISDGITPSVEVAMTGVVSRVSVDWIQPQVPNCCFFSTENHVFARRDNWEKKTVNDESRGKRVPSRDPGRYSLLGRPGLSNSRQRVRQIVIGRGREVKGENRETRE